MVYIVNVSVWLLNLTAQPLNSLQDQLDQHKPANIYCIYFLLQGCLHIRKLLTYCITNMFAAQELHGRALIEVLWLWFHSLWWKHKGEVLWNLSTISALVSAVVLLRSEMSFAIIFYLELCSHKTDVYEKKWSATLQCEETFITSIHGNTFSLGKQVSHYGS